MTIVRNSRVALSGSASVTMTTSTVPQAKLHSQYARGVMSRPARLERAGLDMTPRAYWLWSLACGTVLVVIVTLALPLSATRLFLTIVIGLIGVFGVPRWFVNRLVSRRQIKFIKELPNAIDIVVRGMNCLLYTSPS